MTINAIQPGQAVGQPQYGQIPQLFGQQPQQLFGQQGQQGQLGQLAQQYPVLQHLVGQVIQHLMAQQSQQQYG
ncbi:MAG: hypothetical protein JWN00_2544, partial [Actinomycetia bacterium]|nr:hypothetical protein [Actinomycetes bacterium]